MLRVDRSAVQAVRPRAAGASFVRAARSNPVADQPRNDDV